MASFETLPVFSLDKELFQILFPLLTAPLDLADRTALTSLLTKTAYALVLYSFQAEDSGVCPEPYHAAVVRYLEGTGDISCFEYRGHHMGILRFHSHSRPEIQAEAAALEDKIGRFLSECRVSYGTEVNLSIGRPFWSLLSLRDPYSELINSTVVFSIRPENLAISEYDIQNDPSLIGEPYPQSELERQFSDAILKLEIRKAEKLFEQIMAYELSSIQLRLSFLPRMSSRIDWVLIVLHVPRNSGDSRSANIYAYPYNIQYAEGNTEGIRLIREFFEELDNYYSAFRFNIGKDVTQIIDFIRQQSANSALCATMICDHFRISPSYLSHVFKKRTGVKLVDYINETRIAEAKRLLETSDLSIQEISQQVGYTSNASFATSFKKYEAMTPREYRVRISRSL